MDPFLGLGSTALACVGLGVNFVGVELDRAYLDEAVARTQEAIRVRGWNRSPMPNAQCKMHNV